MNQDENKARITEDVVKVVLCDDHASQPLTDYCLHCRIAELERYESLVKASPNELHVRITELHKCIAELEEERDRLEALCDESCGCIRS